jgi:multidrug transporter EmrE-like cation transporter
MALFKEPVTPARGFLLILLMTAVIGLKATMSVSG